MGKHKRKSGAVTGSYTPKNGANKGSKQYFTNGWMAKKSGLINVNCVTTKHSKKGNKGWISSIWCEVINKTTGTKNSYWGTMQERTGKVVIDDLSWVLNPALSGGGYCGTYIRRD